MNNTTFCSERSPTDTKIEIPREMREERKEFSPASLGNLLPENTSEDNTQSTSSKGNIESPNSNPPPVRKATEEEKNKSNIFNPSGNN